MDKILSYRGRSKSRERSEKTEIYPKIEDIGAASLGPTPTTMDIKTEGTSKDIGAASLGPKPTTMDPKTERTSKQYIKTEKVPDDLFDHLIKDAEDLPDSQYGELITHEDGSPIFYFGATKFQKATKAIWKIGDKVYALDPRKVNIPDDTEHVYENPENTKETGARPKMEQDRNTKETGARLENINKQLKETNKKITDLMNLVHESRAASRAGSRIQSRHQSPERRQESILNNIQDFRAPSRPQSRYQSPNRRQKSGNHDNDDYENHYNYHYNNAQYDTNEGRFAKFVLKQSKLMNLLTPLNHDQGASFGIWLHGLKLEMEKFNIPSEFMVDVAIRKLPDNIRSDVVLKKITTMTELNNALYNIYCGTKNVTSLKTQFFKENKLAPHDRNYNVLRDKIKRIQVPMIISVEQIGQNDIPAVRDRIIEEMSETLSTELFLNAIQEDTKRSVLNKGRHKNFDELVQRANDFASSIGDESPKNRVGNIIDKPNEQKCKIHPNGNHNHSQCRQKCQLHPLGNHKNIDCRQRNQNDKPILTCHPSRAGKHSEPLWCLFCNTVTPKLEQHRCFHCWKCSTEGNAILSKDCSCPNKFKK